MCYLCVLLILTKLTYKPVRIFKENADVCNSYPDDPPAMTMTYSLKNKNNSVSEVKLNKICGVQALLDEMSVKLFWRLLSSVLDADLDPDPGLDPDSGSHGSALIWLSWIRIQEQGNVPKINK